MADEFYDKPKDGWVCFHCGERFTTPGAARAHFGFDPSCDPACIIKMGAERGLVMALRRAERDAEEMRKALHDESTDSAKAYFAQSARHREQLMATEELGYERGLADGRKEAADAIADLRARNDALREALRPFAKAAAIRLCAGDDWWTDDKTIQGTDIAFHITFGDLRRAADALKETSDGN